MNKERISKQDLMKIYNVDRSTIENWIKARGLPMIEISSHSKYISRENLETWENKMIKNKNVLENCESK